MQVPSRPGLKGTASVAAGPLQSCVPSWDKQWMVPFRIHGDDALSVLGAVVTLDGGGMWRDTAGGYE